MEPLDMARYQRDYLADSYNDVAKTARELRQQLMAHQITGEEAFNQLYEFIMERGDTCKFDLKLLKES